LDEAANNVAANIADDGNVTFFSPLFYSPNGKSGIVNVLASFAGLNLVLIAVMNVAWLQLPFLV
jgi:hypothetical protein